MFRSQSVRNESVRHAIFWNDAQLTTVDEMLSEYQEELPKRTFSNLKRFLTQYSMSSTQPNRAKVFQNFIEGFQNGTLEPEDIVKFTPKKQRR
jgi:hypothetical protein